MTLKFYFKISLFVFASIFVLIFYFSYASACSPGESCWPGGSTCTETQSCSSRTEYKCVSDQDCGVEIQQRSISMKQDRTCTCGNCDSEGNNCTYSCGAWSSCYDSGAPSAPSHYSNCPIDQICQLNGDVAWISSVPNCEYLSPSANGQQEDGNGIVSSNNVYLPAKFNWTDVRGAKSYLYRIWEATFISVTWEQSVATTSGSTVISETKLMPCTLNSSTTFSWRISPCCYADQTFCKDWNDVSLWRFTTNLAPELISPLDPDWNNTTQWAVNVEIPVVLDWCDVEEADSYKLKLYIINGGVEDCHPLLKKPDGSCSVKIIEGGSWPSTLNSFFRDIDGYYFLRDKEYRWEVATCYFSGTEICSNFSQKWGFDTTSTLPEIEEFKLLYPLNNAVVSLPVEFRWASPVGIQSFRYEIGPFSGTTAQNAISFDCCPGLNINTQYQWRIRPCSNPDGTNCEDWTSRWRFKITGDRPNLNDPHNNAHNVIIPVNFDWNDVSGAGSYDFQLSKDNFTNVFKEIIIPKSGDTPPISETALDDPVLEMSTQYWWRVRTCAHTDGTVCGDWSQPVRRFTTFQIEPPENLLPDNGTLIEQEVFNLSWDAAAGAKAYRYIIYDPNGIEIVNKITSSISNRHYSIEFSRIDAPYTWKVQSCLDNVCSANKVSNYTSLQNFQINFIAPPESRGDIIPCGRIYEDPDTPCPPFCERDKCQIHHLFILLRNVLEFLLFKVVFILMILLSFVAGLFFHISKGDANVIFKVRSLIKAATIGFLIMFFSWFAINLFLSLIGFKFQLFGHWWELPL